jgi:hypothetical protein
VLSPSRSQDPIKSREAHGHELEKHSTFRRIRCRRPRRDKLPGCHASVVATTPAATRACRGRPTPAKYTRTPPSTPPPPHTPECAAINRHGSVSWFLSARMSVRCVPPTRIGPSPRPALARPHGPPRPASVCPPGPHRSVPPSSISPTPRSTSVRPPGSRRSVPPTRISPSPGPHQSVPPARIGPFPWPASVHPPGPPAGPRRTGSARPGRGCGPSPTGDGRRRTGPVRPGRGGGPAIARCAARVRSGPARAGGWPESNWRWPHGSAPARAGGWPGRPDRAPGRAARRRTVPRRSQAVAAMAAAPHRVHLAPAQFVSRELIRVQHVCAYPNKRTTGRATERLLAGRPASAAGWPGRPCAAPRRTPGCAARGDSPSPRPASVRPPDSDPHQSVPPARISPRPASVCPHGPHRSVHPARIGPFPPARIGPSSRPASVRLPGPHKSVPRPFLHPSRAAASSWRR